jgi:hypothetical protein
MGKNEGLSKFIGGEMGRGEKASPFPSIGH